MDGIANGDETDVDCGGACGACADGAACAIASDCASNVCASTCQTPTCSDGVWNGAEIGLDCGGSCPPTYEGIGCIMGTQGSKICTSYNGGPTFDVTITWNANGGNAYVDYVTAYGSQGEDYNSMGIVGGSHINICVAGPMTVTFSLPLGANYTYKIWHAYCVRDDACSGCGNDVTNAEGGPFGVYQSC
jgi:hypothetical protein